LTTIKKPEYPDVLLKKTWDKKKSLKGKATVKDTGIGDALAALKADYDKMDWSAVDIRSNRAGNLNNYTTESWKKIVADALNELNGPVAKVSAACTDLQKLCEKVEKRFKEKGLADDVKLTQAIAKAAGELGTATARVVVQGQIQEANKEVLENVAEAIRIMKTSLKGPLAKALQFVKDQSSDPNAATFNSGQGSAMRPVTQIIGNYLRYTKAGIDMGKSEAMLQDLWKITSPYGNGEVKLDTNELPDKVLLEVQKLGRILKTVAEKML
jgi:hypothetical protein